MPTQNTQVLLISRPEGWASESNFKVVQTPVATPKDGELLVKNHYLSLDPYMRGRMNAVKSYTKYQELNEVMTGGTVAEVIESKHPKFKAGDFVVTMSGWQQYAIGNGEGWMKVDPKLAPLSYYVGILGMPGATAWIGLNEFMQPKAGETVAVSAASGAVGSVVGQLAKAKGCRVVGIAGGKAKCDYVVKELGFDACVDYKAGNLREDFKAAVPNGVDAYFENVGGDVMDTVLSRLNAFSRIALCGMISEYNDADPKGIRLLRSLLVNRTMLRGFIVTDHLDKWPAAFADIGAMLKQGKMKYHETMSEGIESAPKAFIGMLKGENFGKQLVKLV
jgi:NADPH-dependent curcumin reductase